MAPGLHLRVAHAVAALLLLTILDEGSPSALVDSGASPAAPSDLSLEEKSQKKSKKKSKTKSKDPKEVITHALCKLSLAEGEPSLAEAKGKIAKIVRICGKAPSKPTYTPEEMLEAAHAAAQLHISKMPDWAAVTVDTFLQFAEEQSKNKRKASEAIGIVLRGWHKGKSGVSSSYDSLIIAIAKLVEKSPKRVQLVGQLLVEIKGSYGVEKGLLAVLARVAMSASKESFKEAKRCFRGLVQNRPDKTMLDATIELRGLAERTKGHDARLRLLQTFAAMGFAIMKASDHQNYIRVLRDIFEAFTEVFASAAFGKTHDVVMKKNTLYVVLTLGDFAPNGSERKKMCLACTAELKKVMREEDFIFVSRVPRGPKKMCDACTSDIIKILREEKFMTVSQMPRDNVKLKQASLVRRAL